MILRVLYDYPSTQFLLSVLTAGSGFRPKLLQLLPKAKLVSCILHTLQAARGSFKEQYVTYTWDQATASSKEISPDATCRLMQMSDTSRVPHTALKGTVPASGCEGTSLLSFCMLHALSCFHFLQSSDDWVREHIAGINAKSSHVHDLVGEAFEVVCEIAPSSAQLKSGGSEIAPSSA